MRYFVTCQLIGLIIISVIIKITARSYVLNVIRVSDEIISHKIYSHEQTNGQAGAKQFRPMFFCSFDIIRQIIVQNIQARKSIYYMGKYQQK